MSNVRYNGLLSVWVGTGPKGHAVYWADAGRDEKGVIDVPTADEAERVAERVLDGKVMP